MARQSCKVCYAEVDGFGDIEHGKGCYQYRAEGGGVEHVGFDDEAARRELQASIDDLYEEGVRARELHAKLATIEGRVRLLADSLEAHVTTARESNSLAEHDLLQDALSQLEVVRGLVERARAARSGKEQG